MFFESPPPAGFASDEHRDTVHDATAGGQRLLHVPARRLFAADRQIVHQHVRVRLAQHFGDVDRLFGRLVDDIREVLADAIECAAAADGYAEWCDRGKPDGVVRLGEDGLGQVVADFADIDVEGSDELDVADVIATQIDVHQAGDELVRRGVAVLGDTLDQGRGAVADANDGDPYGLMVSCGHAHSVPQESAYRKAFTKKLPGGLKPHAVRSRGRLASPAGRDRSSGRTSGYGRAQRSCVVPPAVAELFSVPLSAAYHASVATITDVARAAGVSIATVSRVLSPGPIPHPVRPDTAERVRAAARRLRFVPSPIARGLAAGRSGLIGLLVPDLGDPHYPQIAIGVENAARVAQLAVLICNTIGEVDRMTEYLRLLQARRADAIVLSGATSLKPVELLALQQCEVPLVLIGRPSIPVSWPNVSIDNRTGARQAVQHLIKRGFQRILHLGGPRLQTTMVDRARGYSDEMVGRPSDIIECSGTPEDGYERLRQRLDDTTKARPDAVFAATDRLAVAALALAADRHLHVPRELAIIGFDDIPLAASLRPSLSSMAQPADELGAVAIDMVQRLAAGELVQPRLLAARLIERQSTLGPGGRYT